MSLLNLGFDKLTALTRESVSSLGLLDKHFRLLLPAIYQHSLPYDFWEYACNRITVEVRKSSRLRIGGRT